MLDIIYIAGQQLCCWPAIYDLALLAAKRTIVLFIKYIIIGNYTVPSLCNVELGRDQSLGLWMMGDRLIDYLLFTATMLPTVVMQGLVLGIYFRILMILPVIFLFGGTAVTVILISKLTERALAKLPCQIQSH